jgi:hypothetical protein
MTVLASANSTLTDRPTDISCDSQNRETVTVPRYSEPRITVLAKASSNLPYRPTYIGCSVIEVSFFYRTQRSRCLPSIHLRTETDPISEKSCRLEYWATENVRKPVLSNGFNWTAFALTVMNFRFHKRRGSS